MRKRALAIFYISLAIAVLALLAPWVRADPVISPGIPTVNVPAYLADGSYLFATTASLGPDEFLLPVEISDAVDLQNWQFDLLFDNAVVQEVDPGDGSSGIYEAEFTPRDPRSLSFILGALPLDFLGEVDAAAGEYPGVDPR